MSDSVITIKEVGNYGINKINGYPENYYIPVINGKESNAVAETYEVAYLIGLQIKYVGYNENFAKYACRILNIKSAWSE